MPLIILSPANSFAEKNYKIVLLGDGLTINSQMHEQGSYADRMQKKLRAIGYDHIQVTSFGQEDAPISSANSNIDSVIRENPDVIIIQLGFNDSSRGVAATAIGYNLGLIVSKLKETGAYLIVIGVESPREMGESYRYEIAKQYHNVADSNKIPLYENALAGLSDNPTLTMADGRKLSASGIDELVNKTINMVDEGLRWRYNIYLEKMEKQKNSNNDPTRQIFP